MIEAFQRMAERERKRQLEEAERLAAQRKETLQKVLDQFYQFQNPYLGRTGRNQQCIGDCGIDLKFKP